jgi:hypothetical protein
LLQEFLADIWPVCVYANCRFPKLRELTQADEAAGPRLARVLERVLDTLCHKFGFGFASVSLIDDLGSTIRAVATKTRTSGVDPASWKAAEFHSLDGNDIHADVLRTGNVEAITGFDPRLDSSIYDSYGHADLTRVFLRIGTPRDNPAGGLGTIEAGFLTSDRSGPIPELLYRMLVATCNSTLPSQFAMHRPMTANNA